MFLFVWKKIPICLQIWHNLHAYLTSQFEHQALKERLTSQNFDNMHE